MWEPRRLTTLWPSTACYQHKERVEENFVLVVESNRAMKWVDFRWAEYVSRKTFCTSRRTERALKKGVLVIRFGLSVLKTRMLFGGDCSYKSLSVVIGHSSVLPIRHEVTSMLLFILYCLKYCYLVVVYSSSTPLPVLGCQGQRQLIDSVFNDAL
jgi:hypothetical protein